MGQVPIYVRFTKSGNLYIGTYFTTSNSIAARLLPITKKTVKDHLVKMDGKNYFYYTYIDNFDISFTARNWADVIKHEEECVVYSTYKDGFWWYAKGTEHVLGLENAYITHGYVFNPEVMEYHKDPLDWVNDAKLEILKFCDNIM